MANNYLTHTHPPVTEVGLVSCKYIIRYYHQFRSVTPSILAIESLNESISVARLFAS